MEAAARQVVRGPLLVPRDGGTVDFYADGVIAADATGLIHYAGDWAGLKPQFGGSAPSARQADGVMLPPFLDLHTHISQHPIRGHFVDGVSSASPAGRLIEGLKRNVFPAEARCNDLAVARAVTEGFAADTLSHGVVGGAAYMTSSPSATDAALSILPAFWHVGMVLMNQNCPENLRTDETSAAADLPRLAERYGQRFLVTDRFAYAVTSPLRRLAADIAGRFGLRTQTHLNEQVAEKREVEKVLYPTAGSYTDVYRIDGLLDHRCILAHCVQMRPEEWRILGDTGSCVAHCPSSNHLLQSGLMSLDEVIRRRIPYAIATDVGASPTVSLLAEMHRFLSVHAGHSSHATPAEALYRTTLAPAVILGLDQQVGRLEAGRPMSFLEVQPEVALPPDASADDVIRALLPADPDRPSLTVNRVTLNGIERYRRLTPPR